VCHSKPIHVDYELHVIQHIHNVTPIIHQSPNITISTSPPIHELYGYTTSSLPPALGPAAGGHGSNCVGFLLHTDADGQLDALDHLLGHAEEGEMARVGVELSGVGSQRLRHLLLQLRRQRQVTVAMEVHGRHVMPWLIRRWPRKHRLRDVRLPRDPVVLLGFGDVVVKLDRLGPSRAIVSLGAVVSGPMASQLAFAADAALTLNFIHGR
jgi:hypothetical protein